MTSNISTFLPTTAVFSQDASQFLIQLTNLYTQIAAAVNMREISNYNTVQVNSGELWYNTTNTQVLRKGFRRVYVRSNIVPGATDSFVHGLTGITQFTHIYGVATTNVIDYRPIPFASATLITDQIQVSCTSTNIVIVNGATSPTLTTAVIVIEYLYN